MSMWGMFGVGDAPDPHARALVGGAHAFVLLMTRAVGLSPLRFERVPGGKKARWFVSISSTACVVSCITVTIVVSWCLFGLMRELRTEPNMSVRMKSMTARVVGSCDVLAVALTSAAGVFGAPKRTRSAVRVLRLLSNVDNSLDLKLLYTEERNMTMIITTGLLLWTCLIVDDFGLYLRQAVFFNSQTSLLQNYLAFYLLYYVIMMLEVQFAFTAHAIFLRLKRLNAVLAETGRSLSLSKDKAVITKITPVYSIQVKPQKNIVPGKLGALVDALGLAAEAAKPSNNHDVHGSLSDEPAESIRCLSDLHGTLCAAAREVDASYGLPVLIILISTLLHLIVTPYFLILEMGGSHRPHQLVLQTLWCLAHSARLLLLVEPCHRTKAEAAKTGDIVGEMLGHASAGSGVLRRLELFSRQLLHRSPDFTALGVCSLDRPLIASVTAAVTTYLVILIQFQKQDDLTSEING